jgi:hypothetical protein
MPNRVDNPVPGARPEATRPGTQRPGQAEQTAQSAPPPDAATADRIEISNAARQQAEAPAPERGVAQDASRVQRQEGEPSAVGEVTREQAEQLREKQRARAQPESQQPGNMVDVTG